MDGPARRVGCARRPPHLRGSRQPPAPLRARVRPPDRPLLEGRHRGGPRRRAARVGASRHGTRGRAVGPHGARLRARRMVGIHRVRRLHERPPVERHRDRRVADRRRQPRRLLRPGAGREDRGARGRPVPIDGRARAGGQLHRCDERERVDDLHQPAGRAHARVLAAGMDRRRGALAEPAAPRRQGSCDGRERTPQRDGRAVPHGVPALPPRRSRRVGARRGDDDA